MLKASYATPSGARSRRDWSGARIWSACCGITRSMQVEIDHEVQRNIDIFAVFLGGTELPLLERINRAVGHSVGKTLNNPNDIERSITLNHYLEDHRPIEQFCTGRFLRVLGLT